MTDPSRKAFQEFLGDGKFRDDYVTDSHGEYLCPATQIDWELWQASRKQMAEEATAVCYRISSEWDLMGDLDAAAVAGGCGSFIRSLATPTEGKT